MAIKATVLTIAALFGVVATVWGSVTTLDYRYEQRIVHAPLHMQIQEGMNSYAQTALKDTIRDIRNDMRNTNDPAWLQQLRDDLEDAIDRLCTQFPEDRECG